MVRQSATQARLFVVVVVVSVLLMVFTVTLASRVSNGFMREQIAYQRNFLLVEPAIDDWTTCISLLSFSGDLDGRSVLYRASMVSLPVDISEAPCDELIKWVDAESGGDIRSGTYARYWFGGAASVRLLSAASAGLDAARTVIALLWIFALAIYFGFLWQRTGIITALLATGVPFLTTDLVSALKAPHTALTFTASLVLGITVMLSRRSNELVILFATGLWLPFFDPLTHPTFYLYVVMAPIFLHSFQHQGSALVQTRKLVGLGAISVLGYTLSWVAKWSFAAVFGDGLAVFRDSFSQILFRAGGTVDDQPLGLMDGVAGNLREYLERPFTTTIISVFVVYAIFSFVLRRARSIRLELAHVALCIGIGVAPLVVYVVLKSHSFEHSWMTYRSLAMSLGVSLACLYLRDDRIFGKSESGNVAADLKLNDRRVTTKFTSWSPR